MLSAFDTLVLGLVLALVAVTLLAVEFGRRLAARHARPFLPYDDLPPRGLRTVRPREVPAEFERGMAAVIGELRRHSPRR